MKGGCSDLRTCGPNSPVKVFKAGVLIRTEWATTIDDYVGKKMTPNVAKKFEPYWTA